MAHDQTDLFGTPSASAPRAFPEGFEYKRDVITGLTESELLAEIRRLPLQEFQFHGYTGKRRVVSFGWRYDFNQRVLEKTEDMPDFLLQLRDVAADFARVRPGELQQVLVTEYGPGAGIGWHKDKAVFGDVIGISLLSSCQFRLRRKLDSVWERVTLTAEARSAYLLRGPARTEWEHSIPGVKALRYSVTFRNFRDRD